MNRPAGYQPYPTPPHALVSSSPRGPPTFISSQYAQPRTFPNQLTTPAFHNPTIRDGLVTVPVVATEPPLGRVNPALFERMNPRGGAGRVTSMRQVKAQPGNACFLC